MAKRTWDCPGERLYRKKNARTQKRINAVMPIEAQPGRCVTVGRCDSCSVDFESLNSGSASPEAGDSSNSTFCFRLERAITDRLGLPIVPKGRRLPKIIQKKSKLFSLHMAIKQHGLGQNICMMILQPKLQLSFKRSASPFQKVGFSLICRFVCCHTPKALASQSF